MSIESTEEMTKMSLIKKMLLFVVKPLLRFEDWLRTKLEYESNNEVMVPKWALDSQIEISNNLRKQLEDLQKLYGRKTIIEGARNLSTSEVEILLKPFVCEECGCSIAYHLPICSQNNGKKK